MNYKIRDLADAFHGDYKLFPQLKELMKEKDFQNNADFLQNINMLINEANSFKDSPVESLKFSKFKLYDTTGDRQTFEKDYFDRRKRLSTAALLSILGYEEFLGEAEDLIWSVCDEYTWCLPAHLGSGCNRAVIPNNESADGNIYAANIKQEHTLDLFSCETAATLAEICYFLEGKISPLVIHRARTLIKERVLDQYLSLYNSPWWLTSDMNWAAVCAGSIGIAAIYLIKDNQTLAKVISLILSTMDSFLDGFGNDGVTTEGIGYWNYGFGFFTYFSQLLFERTNGKIDLLTSEEKIKNIVLFPQKAFLSDEFVVNYADCAESASIEPSLFYCLNQKFSEFSAVSNKPMPFATNNRWISLFRGFIWHNTNDIKPRIIENSEEFFADCQWLVSKNKSEKGYFSFSAKGGNNNEPHNHNDLGNFILHYNGDTFISDLGSAKYVKGYFGAERYTFFEAASFSHNLPILNGIGQIEGKEAKAEVINVQKGDITTFKLDITRAYHHIADVKSLKREFAFDKLKRRLNLKDDIAFHEIPQSFSERFITKLKPEIQGEQVWIKGKNETCTITCNLPVTPIISEKSVLLHHEATEITAYIIDFPVAVTEKEMKVEFIFSFQ